MAIATSASPVRQLKSCGNMIKNKENNTACGPVILLV